MKISKNITHLLYQTEGKNHSEHRFCKNFKFQFCPKYLQTMHKFDISRKAKEKYAK